MPYRDFFMEYPPGALAVFLPPAAASGHYNAAFKALMALCGIVTLLLVALVLVRAGASASRLWIAVVLLALSPIALGPISLNTYDVWPALLTLGSLAALLAGGALSAGALLGVAFASKVYSVALLPPVLAFIWRTRGRTLALRAAAAFAAAVALIVTPFLVLAPHGLAESFRAQAARALQIESFGAALLVTAHQLGLYSATVVHRTGHAISYDLAGSLPRLVAVTSSVAQALAVLLVLWLYVRGPDNPRRLAVAFFAAVAGFLAFSRFFSPQYMVWLAPLAALLTPVVWVVTAAALVLAQVWFFHYRDVFTLGGYGWLVLARDLLVVALFVIALLALRRHATEDEDPVLLENEAPARIPS